jgi:hypothetical protein
MSAAESNEDHESQEDFFPERTQSRMTSELNIVEKPSEEMRRTILSEATEQNKRLPTTHQHDSDSGNEAFVEQLSEADNQSKHHLKETILETTANIL